MRASPEAEPLETGVALVLLHISIKGTVGAGLEPDYVSGSESMGEQDELDVMWALGGRCPWPH